MYSKTLSIKCFVPHIHNLLNFTFYLPLKNDNNDHGIASRVEGSQWKVKLSKMGENGAYEWSTAWWRRSSLSAH